MTLGQLTLEDTVDTSELNEDNANTGPKCGPK